MSDIVERLRTNPAGGEETDETSLEAAVEIERLREELNFCTGVCGDKWKEIFRLKAALRRIADSPESDSILVLPEGDTVWKVAKEALGE